ncbi:MAG: serine/threonine-protein kinase [Acidobacteriota bacterium]|nr:serine/threonine-protein kinase [Acidobacteriota bacterium]
MKPAAGRTLGRYRLDALLGRGGMAEVYRATDTKLARTVAVKVILATHAAEEHFLERFLREARVVASLEHPNILPVYDFGEENGVPFLVMPYLPGGSLHDRLKAGPVPLAVASSWIAELAGALDAAHAAGVLHRDVKPANVLLGKDDRLFLADFGIAKLLESQTGLTATGVVVGTPVYMAPEQAQGQPASPATDRYALAVVAFEILAGRPPFEGESALSLMHQHVATPPPMLSARVAGLPAGLDAVLSQALAKDPAKRPPTCRAFATGVAAFAPAGITAAQGSGASAIPVPTPATAATVRAPYGRPSLTSDATVLMGQRRGARRAVFAGAGAIAVLAGAWWFVSRPVGQDQVLAPAPPPPASATAAVAPKPTLAPAAATLVPTPIPTRGAPLVKPPPAPPAAREVAVEAAAEADDRAHPLAAARQRLEAARASAHRLTKEDFLFVLAESERALRKHPLNPEAKHLELYARGGLAYVAGNDQVASKVLVEAFTGADRGPKRNAHFIENLLRRSDGSIGPPNGWELALAYGDARGEAAGLLEQALAANPRDPRALKARAQLRKMQGTDAGSADDAPRPWLKRRQRPN